MRGVADKHEAATAPGWNRVAVEKWPPFNVGRFPIPCFSGLDIKSAIEAYLRMVKRRG